VSKRGTQNPKQIGQAEAHSTPSTYQNLSAILDPLCPERRQIILDELSRGTADGTLQPVLKSGKPPRVHISRRPHGAYTNLRIQDTPSFQKWLRDRAAQCEDALRISKKTEAQLEADPGQFLALADRHQCQGKAGRNPKGKGSAAEVPPTPVAPVRAPYLTLAADAAPKAVPLNPRKTP